MIMKLVNFDYEIWESVLAVFSVLRKKQWGNGSIVSLFTYIPGR